MPQKRNPDYAEIARGKTGRVYGNLMSMLTTLKGLPLTYNRDMQEDKEGYFDSVDTLNQTLTVFCAMIGKMTVNVDNITRSAETGQMLATDVADYLVSKGIPFREAHTIVIKICDYARENKKEVHSLSLNEYKRFSQTFDSDVLLINLRSSVESRDVVGGTAPNRVNKAIKEARQQIEVSDE
jgi:argininosuccinate lyase